MHKKTEQRINKIFIRIFKIDKKKINSNLSAKTFNKWDSLAHLNLILALENEFKISFDIERVTTLMSYKLILLELKSHGIK